MFRLLRTATLGVCAFCNVSFAADKPNVLFIVVDDLRPELSCYGKAHIHSPNFDRLASRGTVFLNAHCQQAMCSPSRTSVMTGVLIGSLWL